MATIVFDFDSTIISCESLEIILERQTRDNPRAQEKIKQITEAGIRGKIPFAASLEQRLAIASPAKQDVLAFGQAAFQWLTPGIEELISDLQQSGLDVWIISGGIQESLIPLGERLKIPKSRIQGVRLQWDEKGGFLGIDAAVAFCRSKVEGARDLAKTWESPSIAIGDSMSDFRLYQAGLVDYFIAYTEHFYCKEVLEKGVLRAGNVLELKKTLEGLVNG